MELPEDVYSLIGEYSVPYYNLYPRHPSLKIMETGDASKSIHYTFGKYMIDYKEMNVVKSIEQKGPYQIIHFETKKEKGEEDIGLIEHWDKLYGDLDLYGAIWIPKVRDDEYSKMENRENTPLYDGIEYFTTRTPGCWQVQYANPNTSKRIIASFGRDLKDLYPEAVNVEYKKNGSTEKGYMVNNKPRPRIKMEPFIPDMPVSLNNTNIVEYNSNSDLEHQYNQHTYFQHLENVLEKLENEKPLR
jgi:hypothetical protein